MKSAIFLTLIAGIILVLPAQHVHAEDWKPNFELPDLTDPFEAITNPFSESVEIAILTVELPSIIQKFIDGMLDDDSISKISEKLLYVEKTYPDQFNYLLNTFPEIQQILNYYFSFEKSSLINSIQYTSDSDDIKYISVITLPLQQIAIDDMLIKIVYAKNIEDIDSKQELTTKITSEFLSRVYTLDPQSGNKITLEEHVDSLFPASSNEDVLLAFVETEYIFSLPMIPYDGQLISIDELCQLEIDKQKCDLLKNYAILAYNVAKKDPDAALEIATIVLEIALDVNYKINAGLESELSYEVLIDVMDCCNNSNYLRRLT